MSDKPVVEAQKFGPLAQNLRRLRQSKIALFCLGYLMLLCILAIFAPQIAPYHYDHEDTARYASTPSPPDAYHWLGTDTLGQDVLSRIIYGSRVSLGVSLVTICIEVLVGLPLGLAAGYYGGFTDTALMRITDAMFAFPDILLAILLRAVIAPPAGHPLPAFINLLTLFFALGMVGWPSLARLVRGQALSLRNREYVDAARALGVDSPTIIRRHILPNLLGPVLVQVTQDVAGVALAEATLSFLGLGVQPPYPSWGSMINQALPQIQVYPLLLIGPGLALAVTVMAFNFLGDALNDAFNPRQNQN